MKGQWTLGKSLNIFKLPDVSKAYFSRCCTHPRFVAADNHGRINVMIRPIESQRPAELIHASSHADRSFARCVARAAYAGAEAGVIYVTLPSTIPEGLAAFPLRAVGLSLASRMFPKLPYKKAEFVVEATVVASIAPSIAAKFAFGCGVGASVGATLAAGAYALQRTPYLLSHSPKSLQSFVNQF
jgi:hypothetical protein